VPTGNKKKHWISPRQREDGFLRSPDWKRGTSTEWSLIYSQGKRIQEKSAAFK
jgi:hypothetical protein